MRTRIYRSSKCETAGLHNTRAFAALLVSGIALAIFGCGAGQQVGGTTSSLGGDISPGFGGSLSSTRTGNGQASALSRGAYPMIETSFQLGSIPGDPFDYEKVRVEVELKKADGNNTPVPAFFDGGTTWRMRYTPTAPGKYDIVNIKLNGDVLHEGKLEKRDWTVSGKPKPGFVRIDKGNHAQFALDNGDKYLPIGHNIAWETDPKVSYDSLFTKMHAAGENWSSLWLDQRDGKHLGAAVKDGKTKPGEIDLDVAKKWDSIFSDAEKNDIYFELALENSDAFSTTKEDAATSAKSPSSWDKNPLNAANGGMLKSPSYFFTDPTARTMEKRKLFYILARWGYSPNIMGIELFHDVQNTEAAAERHWDDIAMWHKEMAIFAKTMDPNRHLLTTSSAPGLPLDSNVWETVDFFQSNVYASDLLGAFTTSVMPGKKMDKPFIVSEFGSPDGIDPEGVQLHIGLWSGLMSGASGGAQYWDWDNVEKLNLYEMFKSASGFVTASSLAEHPGLAAADITIDTTQRGALSFGPGAAKRADSGGPTEFVVGSSGPPSGIERLAPVLAGKSSGDKPLTFQTSYAQAGAFVVNLGRVSKRGARVTLAVDGKPQEHDYPAAKADHLAEAENQSVRVEVPAGSHTITVENTGADWISIRRFTLTNYAPALAGVARAGKDYEIAWIYNRDGIEASAAALKSVTPATGQVKLPGLQKGKYRVTWWDTTAGKLLDTTDIDTKNAKDEIALTVPPITRDAALYIIKAGTEKAKLAKNTGRSPANNNQQGSGGNVIPPNNLSPTAPDRPQ